MRSNIRDSFLTSGQPLTLNGAVDELLLRLMTFDLFRRLITRPYNIDRKAEAKEHSFLLSFMYYVVRVGPCQQPAYQFNRTIGSALSETRSAAVCRESASAPDNRNESACIR